LRVSPRKRRPKVYVAHPITTYGTDWAARHLARLAELLPGARLVDPERKAWATSEAWFAEWSSIVPDLSGLVVFGAEDRTVGAGCLQEIIDAVFVGIPIAALDGRRLVELRGFEFATEGSQSAQRAATVRAGRRISPGAFPGGVTPEQGPG
jgi:hypothetical protein